jgi:hypothetical protein
MDLVVGASNDAVKSLGSLLAQEYTLIGGVSDDIQYINDELANMQDFLNRLKQEAKHDEQRQGWMKQVREVAYDIEDCIDNVGHCLSREPRGSGKLASLRRAWYRASPRCTRATASPPRSATSRPEHSTSASGALGICNFGACLLLLQH